MAIAIFIVIIILSLAYFLFYKDFAKKKEDIEEVEEITEENDVKLTEPYLTLDNYVGQEKIIDYLRGHIRRAKEQHKPLDHIILYGSGGLGKSTLIKAISKEMGGRFIEVVPANLRSINDLHYLLFNKLCPYCRLANHFSANRCVMCGARIKDSYIPIIKLKENDILFFEECHGLKQDIEEALYSLMQDGYVILRYNGIDQPVHFPPITIAGATTLLGNLNKPFRDRFKIHLSLQPYQEKEIVKIIKKYCEHKDIQITEEALEKIANISFGIPRIAKKFVDDAITRGDKVSKKEIEEICSLLEIDENGLSKVHRKVLEYLRFRGMAGERAIASTVGVPINTYKESIEPALLQKEYIAQGSRGRILTEKALKEYFND